MKIQNLPPITNLEKEKNCIVRNKTTAVEPLKYDAEIIGNFSKPTLLQFQAIQEAYDFYNKELFYPVFGQLLSPVMLSLNDNYKRVSYGYYAFDKYKDEEGNLLSLINLTPEYLTRTFIKVMGTLVHEMCHHYQYTLGVKKGKRTAYHDKEFAEIMERVGLICSTTGEPGGKQTGRRVSHYVLDGGAFEKLTIDAPESLKTPFTINNNLFGRERNFRDEHSKTLKLKIKYECPNCKNKVWGKPNLQINCVPCNTILK